MWLDSMLKYGMKQTKKCTKRKRTTTVYSETGLHLPAGKKIEKEMNKYLECVEKTERTIKQIEKTTNILVTPLDNGRSTSLSTDLTNRSDFHCDGWSTTVLAPHRVLCCVYIVKKKIWIQFSVNIVAAVVVIVVFVVVFVWMQNVHGNRCAIRTYPKEWRKNPNTKQIALQHSIAIHTHMYAKDWNVVHCVDFVSCLFFFSSRLFSYGHIGVRARW